MGWYIIALATYVHSARIGSISIRGRITCRGEYICLSTSLVSDEFGHTAPLLMASDTAAASRGVIAAMLRMLRLIDEQLTSTAGTSASTTSTRTKTTPHYARYLRNVSKGSASSEDDERMPTAMSRRSGQPPRMGLFLSCTKYCVAAKFPLFLVACSRSRFTERHIATAVGVGVRRAAFNRLGWGAVRRAKGGFGVLVQRSRSYKVVRACMLRVEVTAQASLLLPVLYVTNEHDLIDLRFS